MDDRKTKEHDPGEHTEDEKDLLGDEQLKGEQQTQDDAGGWCCPLLADQLVEHNDHEGKYGIEDEVQPARAGLDHGQSREPVHQATEPRSQRPFRPSA